MRMFLTSMLRAFQKDKGGVSAVEFAIIFPVMLVLLLGTVSIGQAIAIQRKMTLLTRSTADMVAQSETYSFQDSSNMQYTPRLYMVPYNVNPLNLIISQVYRDAGGNTKIDWSTGNKTFHPVGAPWTLPADQPLGREKGIIVSEAFYEYRIPFGQNLFGNSIQLSSVTYMMPRIVDRVGKNW